jgi:predicted N-acetyltransferase YhbS
VHPDHCDLEPELIEWAMARLPVQPETAEAVQLILWSLESDDTRNQALETHGFVQTEQFYTSYLWTLDAPPPAPVLPVGYTLRHVMGEHDVEARVAVHRSAFHPSRMTVAKQRAVMGAPTYRMDLDLVVVAPDASFAGYTIVWYDPINRSGLFEPVGVHADHRRKGLGRAVLYAGLQRLQALGARRAHVLSHGDDSEGAKLYQHAGFATIDRFRGWKKVFERKISHESKSAG